MGTFNNIVKLEEMRKKLDENDPVSAMNILETMDIRKIKNNSDLSLMAEVYSQNEHYEEAMDLLLKIYQKAKTRRILYQMVLISIQNNNAADAEKYLAEYELFAPRDFYRYIFRYRIDKLNGESFEKLIETLEALKKSEYMEQWAYELAKLYYKAGMEEKCIKECSDIILWFGEGTYVEKAKMLRAYYSGETDKEHMIEELKRRAREERAVAQVKEDTENEVETEPEYEAEEDTQQVEYIDDGEATFSDELKREVQEVMIQVKDDPQEETGLADYDEAGISQEYEQEELPQIEFPEKYQYEENTEESFDEKSNYSYSTELNENGYAGQEEETKPQYQSDEKLDEDDKRLIELSNELGFDIEAVFYNFLHVKNMKKQIVKSLDIILNENAKSIQLMITGTAGSGKTTLAKDISIFLNKTGLLKFSKVAKIDAGKLNAIDLMTKKETLKDCCMIIENASELKKAAIDQILELERVLRGDIVVIFEENKKNMNKLFRECPKLMDLFKNRIHLPQYSEEDLLGFAYSCLNQQDYKLHPDAYPILSSKVSQIARQKDSDNHLDLINRLVKSAMGSTDVRTGKQLSNLATEGRLMDVKILTILPEDFNV